MKLIPKITGIIVLLILVVLSLIDGSSMTVTSRWIPFLGRFHPVLLHLPIGIFAGVVLLELYVMVRPVVRVPEKIHFLLTAAFYTTALSALFGVFLSWEGGYEAEALSFHKWGGLATAASILALDGMLKGRQAHPEKLPSTYWAGLVITIGVMSVTGHGGGSLTHGSDFLTEFNPFVSETAEEVSSVDVPVFASHIQPVLEDYCTQCHNPEKIKGELRLDSFEMILAGGVNGPVVVPGDSGSSNLLHVIHLPLDEDEHMPPKGKPQPSTEVAQLLAWWIDQGASDTAMLDELNVTPEVATHFLEIDVLDFQTREEVDLLLATLEENESINIYYLAQEDHRLGVRANKAANADLHLLLPLKSNIVELNLAKSGVTNAGLETIGQMTNLTHLHLNNTAVSDAGMEHLSHLYQLEYLNLYGTDITDSGLKLLHRLKNLKKVFLWETGVTRDGVAGLHDAVFNAVGSENLRMQIQELNKKRDSLEVDIVSAFDFELQPVEVNEEKSEISISSVMVDFHKGDNSIANQAKEGNAAEEDLQRMLERYREMLDLSPPEGLLRDWKSKTSKLIEATEELIEDAPGAIESYKTAVNCKACHSVHRSD